MEVCTKALYENLPRAIELMEELILTTDFTDTKRLKETLAENNSKFRPDVNPQIFVAHHYPEYSQSTGIRKALLAEITCPAYIIYVPGSITLPA